MYRFTSRRSKGTRMSSCLASASHLPEALIQRTSSSLIDVLPVLAWVSNGSSPIRADSSLNCASSPLFLFVNLLLIPNSPLQFSFPARHNFIHADHTRGNSVWEQSQSRRQKPGLRTGEVRSQRMTGSTHTIKLAWKCVPAEKYLRLDLPGESSHEEGLARKPR